MVLFLFIVIWHFYDTHFLLLLSQEKVREKCFHIRNSQKHCCLTDGRDSICILQWWRPVCFILWMKILGTVENEGYEEVSEEEIKELVCDIEEVV